VHLEHDARSIGPVEAKADAAAGTMREGVAEQIGNQLCQSIGIPDTGHIARAGTSSSDANRRAAARCASSIGGECTRIRNTSWPASG
jgi:hypothetical protein